MELNDGFHHLVDHHPAAPPDTRPTHEKVAAIRRGDSRPKVRPRVPSQVDRLVKVAHREQQQQQQQQQAGGRGAGAAAAAAATLGSGNTVVGKNKHRGARKKAGATKKKRGAAKTHRRKATHARRRRRAASPSSATSSSPSSSPPFSPPPVSSSSSSPPVSSASSDSPPLRLTPMTLVRTAYEGNAKDLRRLLARAAQRQRSVLRKANAQRRHGPGAHRNSTQREFKRRASRIRRRSLDVDANDATRGMTALGWAARRGHADVVTLLLSSAHGSGADVQAPDPVHRRTALHHAAFEGHVGVVRILIDHDAHLDPRDGRGNTPLLLAAQRGHAQCVLALLSAGARIDARNQQDTDAATVAKRMHHGEVLRVLRGYEARVQREERQQQQQQQQQQAETQETRRPTLHTLRPEPELDLGHARDLLQWDLVEDSATGERHVLEYDAPAAHAREERRSRRRQGHGRHTRYGRHGRIGQHGLAHADRGGMRHAPDMAAATMAVSGHYGGYNDAHGYEGGYGRRSPVNSNMGRSTAHGAPRVGVHMPVPTGFGRDWETAMGAMSTVRPVDKRSRTLHEIDVATAAALAPAWDEWWGRKQGETNNERMERLGEREGRIPGQCPHLHRGEACPSMMELGTCEYLHIPDRPRALVGHDRWS